MLSLLLNYKREAGFLLTEVTQHSSNGGFLLNTLMPPAAVFILYTQ